jgi:tight adherence protein B
MDPTSLALPILVAMLTIALVILLLRGASGVDGEVQARLATYERVGDETPYAHRQPVTNVLRQRELSRFSVVQSALRGSSRAEHIAQELAEAGVPLRVGEYLILRCSVAILLALPVLVVGAPLPLMLPLGLFGFFLPKFWVSRRKQQRLVKFNETLVDALIMMANALKSGSSFLQALDLVSRELTPPLSLEFARAVGEISIGTPVDDALTNMCKRIPSYDLYLTVTAILVQRQTGGNLAEVLQSISHTIRERFRLIRQVQVLTAQERMSAIVVAALPVVGLIGFTLISPSYMHPMFDTFTGHMMLGAAFGFEVVGFVVMGQVAKIDVELNVRAPKTRALTGH